MKKKIINTILVIIILIIAVISFSGCSNRSLSKEKKEGLNYVSSKYSKNMYTMKSINKAFNVYDKNIEYRIMLSDGKSILKINNEYYDDIQSEQIRSDFEKYFCEKILGGDYSRNDITIFTEYDTRVTDYKVYKESLSIFKDYYDGNIEKYIQNNDLIVEGKVVVWCQKEDFEQKYQEIEERIKETNINYKYSIAFVDSSLKSGYEDRENIYKLKYDFTQEGVFCIMRIDGHSPVKYINIQNGFGVNLYTNSDFELKLEDITLISDIPTNEELNYIEEQKYGTMRALSASDMHIEPTYRIKLSDRVIKYLKDTQKDYLEITFINNNYTDFKIYHIGNASQTISNSKMKVYDGSLVYKELSSYYNEVNL